MKRTAVIWIHTFLMVALGGASAWADGGMPADPWTRLAALENEIAQLRQVPTHSSIGTRSGGCPQVPCGQACCSCRPGIYGGGEAVFLRPYFEEQVVYRLDGGGIVDPEIGADFDYDFEIQPRVFLGYSNQCGWGVRSSYFRMEQATEMPVVVQPGETIESVITVGNTDFPENLTVGVNSQSGFNSNFRHDFELEVLDTLLTRSGGCRGLRWEIAGGVRYARVDHQFIARYLDTLVFDHAFEGIGPALQVQVRRAIGRGLHLDCRAGGAVLFGDSEASISQLFDDFEFQTSNGLLPIAELGVGVQKTWQLNCCEFFSRVGWEGQIWHGAGSAISTSADMALQGFTVGVGISR